MTDNAPEKSVSTETVAEPVADTSNPEIQVDAPSKAESPPEPEAPQRRWATDERAKRLREKADRLKAERAADNPPEFHGDFRDPTQSIGNMARPAEEPPPPTPNQQTTPTEARESGPSDSQGQPQPAKRTLKVRHGTVELTEEEIIAAAQKALAGDSYLEDARRARDEAIRINEWARQQAQNLARRGPGAPHQGQPSAQPQLPSDPSQGQPHQEDRLAKVIEEVQFGADPKEVANKLRSVMGRPPTPEQVARVARQAMLDQRMTDDLSNTLSAFARVKKANEDVFAEPRAEAIMEDMLREGWRDDLRSIGVPEERIPRNPNDLQKWHRFYRVNGHRVRDSETLFNDVIKGYREYRGQSTPSQQTPPRQQSTNRPQVAVNRTERRASIPTQPTRSGIPPTVPTSAQPRKSIEQVRAEMREARKRGYGHRRPA